MGPNEVGEQSMLMVTAIHVVIHKDMIYSRANAPTGSAGEERVSSCWVAVAGFWWVLVVVVVVVVVDVDVDVVVVVAVVVCCCCAHIPKN